jgi:hypothetical protein
MSRWLGVLASVLLLPVLARAQPLNPADSTRGALRERANPASKGQNKAKLDEALRKFN